MTPGFHILRAPMSRPHDQSNRWVTANGRVTDQSERSKSYSSMTVAARLALPHDLVVVVGADGQEESRWRKTQSGKLSIVWSSQDDIMGSIHRLAGRRSKKGVTR